jgi:peptidoglycan/LPS O-acetylase OafA/YrhL
MLKFLVKNYKDSFLPKPIPGLDGIRAISCLLVIVGHFSYLYAPLLESHLGIFWGSTIAFCLGNQYTGVTLFFVLSGFLITNILAKEYIRSGKIDLRNFFIKRVFRIFPAYYFYFTCIFLWLTIYGLVHYSFQDILASLTFSYNYFSDLNPWHLAHFWSLAVEEQFYLIWPLLFLLYYKKLGSKLPWIIIILSPILRIATYYAFPELRARMSIFTHTRFDSLIFGCLLAYYYQDNQKFEKLNAIILKYKLHWVGAFHIFFFSRILQTAYQGKYVMTIGYTIDCLCMCFLIVYIIQNKSKLVNFLNKPLLVHFGNLSYSLYLWHVPFAWYFLGSKNLIARLCAIYFCALVSYLLIESPLINYRKSKFKNAN